MMKTFRGDQGELYEDLFVQHDLRRSDVSYGSFVDYISGLTRQVDKEFFYVNLINQTRYNEIWKVFEEDDCLKFIENFIRINNCAIDYQCVLRIYNDMEYKCMLSDYHNNK